MFFCEKGKPSLASWRKIVTKNPGQRSPNFNAEGKVKLLKAAWDAVGSEFGSRHTRYEMFYAGARLVTGGHSYRTFDWSAARGMVDHLLSTYDLAGVSAPAAG